MKKVQEYNNKCSFILVGTKEDLLHQDGDSTPVPPPDLGFVSNVKQRTQQWEDKTPQPMGVNYDDRMKAITRWGDENGIPFFPTSAKLTSSNGITFLFHTVAEKCVRLYREKQLQEMTDNQQKKITLGSSIGPPSNQNTCCQSMPNLPMLQSRTLY